MLSGFLIALVVAIVLLVRLTALRRRIDLLERRLDALDRAARQPAAHPSASTPPVADPRPPERSASPPAPRTSGPIRAKPSPPIEALAIGWLRHGFTEGNVPVKIGMLVLFAGVAALLKYAADQGWMKLPIEARLCGIAAFGVAGLAFGWRQRRSRRNFALSLQGGAIGVLLLTVFAAFRLYPVLPGSLAFILSIGLVIACGALAVTQNALALAVLGILAGFLAPLWLSEGSGHHVALFSYYAMLDAAIFMIAWWRAWRALNLLGFAFTFGIATTWGALQYRAEYYATTEPFLLLFFALYLLLPILYARRRAPNWRDLIDGSLVFGTPLIAFSLQAQLLQEQSIPLGLCALGLAGLYAGLAAGLQRRAHFRPLALCHWVIAGGFATLAVPLSLSARATAGLFAIEGAALIWLGLRQNARLPQWTGAGLQALAALSFVIGRVLASADERAIANPSFMGALLVSLGGLASAWQLRLFVQPRPALAFYLWGLAWWLGNGLHEIGRFVAPHAQADAMLALAALSAWVAAEVHRRRPAPALAWTTATLLAAGLPLAVLQSKHRSGPFAEYGGWVWALYAGLGLRSLFNLRRDGGRELGWAHAAWLWVWLLVLGLSLAALPLRSPDLSLALWMLPWLLGAALAQWRPAWIAWPLSERFAAWRRPLTNSWLALLAVLWCVGLGLPADSPLPWLPLLNPLELAQIASLLIGAAWLRSAQAAAGLRRRHEILAAASFVLLTVMMLRGLNHWGDTPWSAPMFSTSLVQTGLTLLWSLLGMASWILGSRRGQRALWLAGATLMAVVLAKLVLVDRSHLGNLLGIASFIAYGLLCTAVGYFAPAPPKAASAASADSADSA